MCICAAPTTPFEGVTVYGRRQAADYQEVRRFFDGRGVVFDHADIEGDQARKAEQWDMGARIRAVDQGPGGEVFLLEDGPGGRLLKLTPVR